MIGPNMHCSISQLLRYHGQYIALCFIKVLYKCMDAWIFHAHGCYHFGEMLKGSRATPVRLRNNDLGNNAP